MARGEEEEAFCLTIISVALLLLVDCEESSRLEAVWPLPEIDSEADPPPFF